MKETINLTKKQQRLLTLVYKFRFVTAPLLSKVLNIRHDSTYEALELLIKKELVNKVYKKSWRIDRRPAHYYLSKKGVTTIRKLLDLNDSAVGTIYQDHRVSEEFIKDCLITLACYIPLKQQYPDAIIRTKTEINRYDIFPKHRPDMYIKTLDGQEVFVVIMPDKLPYFVNNRLDEYINHSEDEGWRGEYPTLAFVVKNDRYKDGFLFKSKSKLENLGMDESEITILATGKEGLLSGSPKVWSNTYRPSEHVSLF